MGKSKDYEAALKRLQGVHLKYVEERATLRARIEEECAAKLHLIRVEQDAAAAAAFVAGAPKSRIGRAMGTQNWETIRDAIASGIARNPGITEEVRWGSVVPIEVQDGIVVPFWWAVSAAFPGETEVMGVKREGWWVGVDGGTGGVGRTAEGMPDEVRSWVEEHLDSRPEVKNEDVESDEEEF